MHTIFHYFLLFYLPELLYKPASVINASHSVTLRFTKYGKIREAVPYKRQMLLLLRNEGLSLFQCFQRGVCAKEKKEKKKEKRSSIH